MDIFLKIVPISDHVAKFRGDRPRDRGDLTLNEKKEKKKQQQIIRAAFALSQRAALKIKIIMGDYNCSMICDYVAAQNRRAERRHRNGTIPLSAEQTYQRSLLQRYMTSRFIVSE